MPSRRALLGALGVGTGLVAVAGCGIRLESQAPATATADARVPIPDEALLLTLTDRATELAGLAARVPGTGAPGAIAAAAAPRHTAQARVLQAILDAAAVPRPTPAAASTGATASHPAASSAPTGATAAALGAREAALPAVQTASTHRDLLTALLAHDGATATLLGATPTWPTPPGSLPAVAAVAALGPTRAARYAVQVAAARRSVAARGADLELDAALRRREVALLAAAGTDAPAPALGYAVPTSSGAVVDPDRLVSAALTGLVERGLDPLAAVPADSPALVDVARLLAEAVVLAAARGVAVTPFPGMITP